MNKAVLTKSLTCLLTIFLYCRCSAVADGISVTQDRKHLTVPHTVLKLNEKQRNDVERLRTITLTRKQRAELEKLCPDIPKKFEVLSSRYDDCTCMMADYAIWCRIGEVDVPHGALASRAQMKEMQAQMAEFNEDSDEDKSQGMADFVYETVIIDSNGKMFLNGKPLDQSGIENLLLDMKKKGLRSTLCFDVPPPIDEASEQRIRQLVEQTGKLAEREGVDFFAIGLERDDSSPE